MISQNSALVDATPVNSTLANPAPGIPQVVELRQGLSAEDVHQAILKAARGSGVAMRMLAFHAAQNHEIAVLED